jgi:hypothetical protein
MLVRLTTWAARRRRPLKRRRSPALAALCGLILGGIGVGLYLRSPLDGLIAFGLAMCGSIAFVATQHPGTALLAVVTPAIYGYQRARLSNGKLRITA